MDQKNLDIYGSEPIPWSRALKALESAATKPEEAGARRRTGWPRFAPTSGRTSLGWAHCGSTAGSISRVAPGTFKSRNLAENPNCVVSVALSGPDLVVEGTARLKGKRSFDKF